MKQLLDVSSKHQCRYTKECLRVQHIRNMYAEPEIPHNFVGAFYRQSHMLYSLYLAANNIASWSSLLFCIKSRGDLRLGLSGNIERRKCLRPTTP